ncbi:Uncharacterised protein [Chromobacterium violaceum]|uniref:Uncharacterized protein n=1 Tax=Chromobacterium violaceum TaxID=536 RepID=A0A447TK34_CHRVL|nr:Uncharacterised protein [Chromobacterium violaceum]
MDLWGAERGLEHGSLTDFIAHLSNYAGAPGFGLAAATAAAAAGLAPTTPTRCARRERSWACRCACGLWPTARRDR